MYLSSFISEWKNQGMFYGAENLKLQLYWNTRLLKGCRKRANNLVDEGTNLPKIIRFRKIFKEAI